MKRERIKALIELSSNIEEADEIVRSEAGESVKEKIAFLKGMFDFSLVGRHSEECLDEEENESMDYFSILNAIINMKWEA